jgi:hypothetical protein
MPIYSVYTGIINLFFNILTILLIVRNSFPLLIKTISYAGNYEYLICSFPLIHLRFLINIHYGGIRILLFNIE